MIDSNCDAGIENFRALYIDYDNKKVYDTVLNWTKENIRLALKDNKHKYAVIRVYDIGGKKFPWIFSNKDVSKITEHSKIKFNCLITSMKTIDILKPVLCSLDDSDIEHIKKYLDDVIDFN